MGELPLRLVPRGSGTVEIWHQSSPKCHWKDKPTASETLFTGGTVESYQPALSSSIALLYLTSMTLRIKGSWNEPTISHETRVRGQAMMVPSTSVLHGRIFLRALSSAHNSFNVDLLCALPLKMLAHVSWTKGKAFAHGCGHALTYQSNDGGSEALKRSGQPLFPTFTKVLPSPESNSTCLTEHTTQNVFL